MVGRVPEARWRELWARKRHESGREVAGMWHGGGTEAAVGDLKLVRDLEGHLVRNLEAARKPIR